MLSHTQEMPPTQKKSRKNRYLCSYETLWNTNYVNSCHSMVSSQEKSLACGGSWSWGAHVIRFQRSPCSSSPFPCWWSPRVSFLDLAAKAWGISLIKWWLVGGDWNMNFSFPYTGDVIIPIDELIFFQRVSNHQPDDMTCFEAELRKKKHVLWHLWDLSYWIPLMT